MDYIKEHIPRLKSEIKSFRIKAKAMSTVEVATNYKYTSKILSILGEIHEKNLREDIWKQQQKWAKQLEALDNIK